MYKKPNKLKSGDTVAVLSPSWAGPCEFPHIYDNGLKVLKEWGLEIKEFPTTRAENDFVYNNPKARADDINAAFSDKDVKAIFASIGGEDSIRVLKYLDRKIISENPKILMGFSDTTTMLTFLNLNNVVSFYGPSIMAGFSQMESLTPRYKQHVYNMLFNPETIFRYQPYEHYCSGYLDWTDTDNTGKTKTLKPSSGWRLLQGSGAIRGELFGGCIEVLEFLKGTEFWPSQSFWEGKVLFFETSEDKPSTKQIKYMLRNYGVQGIFDKVNAVLFARPYNYSDEETIELEKVIKEVISVEFNLVDLPVIVNMDFGHTDPKLVLPLGIKAEINCENLTFTLIESWLE